MKVHLENDSGNSYHSLVRSTVHRIDGGNSSQSIISQAPPELSRCGPEDLRNHTGKAAASKKYTSLTPTNRNCGAATQHSGRPSLNDRGSVRVEDRSDDKLKCRLLSSRLGNTSPRQKFRSTENLPSGEFAGKSESGRPTSAVNCRAQGSLPTGLGRTMEQKDRGHRRDRRDSETGQVVMNRSRSIDASSGSAPRSRSVEARSRTPLRSLVGLTTEPSPSAYRISRESVPAAAVCDVVAEKQVVVLSKPGAKRESVTKLMMTESSSTVLRRNGLQQKLSSGRLEITADKLLPDYQPKRKLQSSVSYDATSVADSSKDAESGNLRTSRSLRESVTMPLLSMALDDYPEPPPPEEDLNAKMELLFEEYRKVELGLNFKNKHQEELQESKQLDKQRPVERGRRRSSVDSRSNVHSAQNRRARSASRDCSLTESRTSRKELPWTVNAGSDVVKSIARNSRTLTKSFGPSQAYSKTHAGSTCVSIARPSITLATAPSCPRNLTQPVVKGTQTSNKPAKPLGDANDLQNQKHKSSDKLQLLLGNRNENHKKQKSGSEVPTRDLSVTRNLRLNSTNNLSSQTTEDCSRRNTSGRDRSSRDTSSCNVKNNGSATTTNSQHTPNQSDVPPRNIMDGHRVTLQDLTSTGVPKVTEPVTESVKLGSSNEQLNGNRDNKAANAVTSPSTEKSVELRIEEKVVATSIKTTIRRDERAGPQSKIPVPVYSKKFYSVSPRSLKRCDSGVDIAHNYQPEVDSTGLRVTDDEELKSST